ncbi:GxxExxY protein [Gemmatimonas sp.]|uniref:GxxExxY protein n=1 Tax=Gemmatimonas sp. TaxID=1962908 RepID=UPI0039832972
MELLHGELTAGILARFRQVYAKRRHGHPEEIYQRAMAIALADAGCSVARELLVVVRFRGHAVGRRRLDLVVDDLVMY